MFILGLTCGLLGEFVLARIMDALGHRSAMRIKYDCSKCAYKCNGFHCYTMRQEIADDLKQGGIADGISDVSGQNRD